MSFKTVKLELLRKGEQFAALLSPTTDYYALCDNHEVVNVHVPFDHQSFLYRIQALRYAYSRGTTDAAQVQRLAAHRRHELDQLSKDLRVMLEQIPGLTGELNADERKLTHLRIVVSAPELAVLPFELALGLHGTSSSGLPLALQPVAPLTITREVRRDVDRPIEWPRAPRILFVSATPPRMKRVPVKAHLIELRRAIEPWVGNEAEGGTKVSDLLTVVTKASLEKVRRCCREQRFTHIHVLAHGAKLSASTNEDGFGLALWDRQETGTDVVGGQRLVDALRGHLDSPSGDRDADGFLAAPTVVTIAACDSGNMGDVAAPGSSLAHTLHSNGVPLVVGSQFPLTMGGSVILAQVLYRRLIQGDDPRLVLHDLRQQLDAASATNHDWASLIVYAMLPENLEDQLKRIRSEWSRRSIGAAMANAEKGDPIQKRLQDGADGDRSDDSQRPDHHVGEHKAPAETDTIQDLEESGTALDGALTSLPGWDTGEVGVLLEHVRPRVEELGLQASLLKRRARVYHRQAEAYHDAGDEALARTARAGERAALLRSRDLYADAFAIDRGSHWTGVQAIALTLVLGATPDEQHWSLCESGAKLDTKSTDPATRAWGYASLVELTLLKLEVEREGTEPNELDSSWKKFCGVATARELRPTVRQLARYELWFTQRLKRASKEAKRLLDDARDQIRDVLDVSWAHEVVESDESPSRRTGE